MKEYLYSNIRTINFLSQELANDVNYYQLVIFIIILTIKGPNLLHSVSSKNVKKC